MKSRYLWAYRSMGADGLKGGSFALLRVTSGSYGLRHAWVRDSSAVYGRKPVMTWREGLSDAQ